MTSPLPQPTVRVRRQGNLESYDRDALFALLDEAYVCYVAVVVDEQPLVIPMAFARRGDELILHGSIRGRLMHVFADGADVSLCVMHLDGLVLARSVFHHSMNYRSAIVFGRASLIDTPEEKRRALVDLTEFLTPGRTREARGMTAAELAATMVVTLKIERASLKSRSGPPNDPKSDLGLDVWAGVAPLTLHTGAPIQDPLQRDQHRMQRLVAPREYLRRQPRLHANEGGRGRTVPED